MPNKMHASWIAAKDRLEAEVAWFKQNGGLNSKPVEEALKTFKNGLGPKLDNVGAAYKNKKDADVKKNAGAALTVAQGYKSTLAGMLRGPGLSQARADSIRFAIGKVDDIIQDLVLLKEKGSSAPDVV